MRSGVLPTGRCIPRHALTFLSARIFIAGACEAYSSRAQYASKKTNRRARDEWQMRVRVISQTFTDLWRNRDMLNPLRSGFFGIQLISHKVLRYAVPLVLIALFALSAVLATHSQLYTVALAIQCLFYLLARRLGNGSQRKKDHSPRDAALFCSGQSRFGRCVL